MKKNANHPARTVGFIRFLTLFILLAVLLTGCRGTFGGDDAVEPPAPTLTPTPLPTPTPTSTPTHTPTPIPQAQTATATPVPTPDTVGYVITEAEINSLIRQGLEQQDDVPVSEVRVDLQPGRIVITARASLGIISADIAIVATVPVSNCRPEPQIESISMNGGDVPGFIRTQIESMIEPYLQEFSGTDLGICVEQVIITDTEIQTIGRYQ